MGAITVTFLSNGLLLWGLDALLISGVKAVLFVAIIALLCYDRSAGKLYPKASLGGMCRL